MSIINMPDLHPGRCKNHREGERCLDYDDVEHVCTFKRPMPQPPSFWQQQTSPYASTPPTPWVKPDL